MGQRAGCVLSGLTGSQKSPFSSVFTWGKFSVTHPMFFRFLFLKGKFLLSVFKQFDSALLRSGGLTTSQQSILFTGKRI